MEILIRQIEERDYVLRRCSTNTASTAKHLFRGAATKQRGYSITSKT